MVVVLTIVPLRVSVIALLENEPPDTVEIWKFELGVMTILAVKSDPLTVNDCWSDGPESAA
jgi:hypothetical protein